MIYELAFTTDAEDAQEILQHDAAEPSKALLLTCRQIYNEAGIFQNRVNRTYWNTTKFALDKTGRRDLTGIQEA